MMDELVQCYDCERIFYYGELVNFTHFMGGFSSPNFVTKCCPHCGSESINYDYEERSEEE